MSTIRSGWGPLKRGPNGKSCCRWCDAELPSDRRSYCSTEHYHLFLEHNDPNYQRRKVWIRDQGVCRLCMVDTCADDVLRLPPPGQRLAKHYWWGRGWEMDHIVPVCEGGGQTGLENLRTLCVPCHRQVTHELTARRFAAGRVAREAVDRRLQPSLFESVA